MQGCDRDCERTNFAVIKIDGAIEAFVCKHREVISHFLNLAITFK